MGKSLTPERRAKLEATLNARAATGPTTNARPVPQGLINNIISAERAQLMRAIFDPRRDLDAECGYPATVTTQEFRRMYDREMGRRVVNVYPEETWKLLPKIFEDHDPETETPFEESLELLEHRHHLLHYLQRADELSGVGHYGVILWGLDDGKLLDVPVDGCTGWDEATGGIGATTPGTAKAAKRNILYIRVLDESLVQVASYERRVENPRYGLPEYYIITLSDPYLQETAQVANQPQFIQTRVHWSRVTHVADNRKTSEVLGTPRQEPVWHRLLDLRKILGGNGEMFWKGGFPGISLETQAGNENAMLDVDKTRDMMWEYQNGLQRYLALTGMSAKPLNPQIAEPTASFEAQVKAICVTLGVPYRVFMGIEEGVVSGDQATKAWAGRLANRQTRYVTPMLINPAIQRLIDYGVLAPTAEPRGWTVEWPNLLELTDTEKAEVASKRTDAFAKYVQGGVDNLIPPLEFLTTICGMTDREAQQIVEAAVQHIEDGAAGETVPGHAPTPPELLTPEGGQNNPAGGPGSPQKGTPGGGGKPKPKAPAVKKNGTPKPTEA